MSCGGTGRPNGLGMELEDGDGAEQPRPGKEAAEPPRREHHQRQCDPASASGQPGREELRIGERQVSGTSFSKTEARLNVASPVKSTSGAAEL